MAEIYLNNMRTTLASAIDNSQTTLDINSLTGWPTGTDTYRIVVCRPDKTNFEIMEVIDSSSYPTLTVVRAAEFYGGSVGAISHAQNELVIIVLTAGGLAALVPNVPIPTLEQVLIAGNDANGNSIGGLSLNMSFIGPDGNLYVNADASFDSIDHTSSIQNTTYGINVNHFMQNFGPSSSLDASITMPSGSLTINNNFEGNQRRGSIDHFIDISDVGHIENYGSIADTTVAVSVNVEAMGNRVLYKDTYYTAHGGNINAPLTMNNEAFGSIDSTSYYTTVSGNIGAGPTYSTNTGTIDDTFFYNTNTGNISAGPNANSTDGSITLDPYAISVNSFASFQPTIYSTHSQAYTGFFAHTTDGGASAALSTESQAGSASITAYANATETGIEFGETLASHTYSDDAVLIYRKKFRLAANIVNTLNSSPVLLVTTPANTIPVPLFVSFKYKFNTTPFTIADNINIGQPGGIGAILGFPTTTWLNGATEDSFLSVGGYTASQPMVMMGTTASIGTGLYVYFEANDPTGGGDGYIDVTLHYTVIESL